MEKPDYKIRKSDLVPYFGALDYCERNNAESENIDPKIKNRFDLLKAYSIFSGVVFIISASVPLSIGVPKIVKGLENLLF